MALYGHNGKDGEDVDTCLLSSIPAGNSVHLVSFLNVWMIAMKCCDVFGGICLVYHVYAHLVLGCVFAFFWMCGLWFVLGFIPLFCVGLCFNVVCLVFCMYHSFLCVCVSVSGDVISGMCVVPDQSSWLSLYLILSLQIRYYF